ncbi:MAG: DUF4340 domain-containing protein [Bdellovibrionota bacterium]
MKSKTIIFLVITIGILSGVAYWDEQKTDQEKEVEKTKNLLVKAQKEEIYEIAITDSTNDTSNNYTIEKREGAWTISKPITAPADQSVVNNFINSVLEYKYHQKVSSEKKEWDKFGVNDKAKSISIKQKGPDDSNSEVILYVGNNAPIGYSTYSRTNASDDTYVGSQYLQTLTSKKLNEFRDKTIIKINEADLTSLAYHMRLQKPILFTRDDKGYHMNGSENFKVDQIEVSSLVGAINSAKATTFADPPINSDLLKSLTEQNAAYKISWQIKDGSTQLLLIGRFEKNLWATLDPAKVAYKLPDNFEEKIRKVIDDFRDHRIFSFDSEQLLEVTLNGKHFKKKENQWYPEATQNTEPKDSDKASKTEPAEYIKSLVVDLEFVKTSEFIATDSMQYKDLLQKAPEHRITLKFSENQVAPITIDLWNSKEDGKYLTRTSSNSDYLFLIPKETIDSNLKERDESSQNASIKDKKTQG